MNAKHKINIIPPFLSILLLTSVELMAQGTTKVYEGVTVNPSTIPQGQNFTVTFKIKEVDGASVTIAEMAIAILDNNGNLLFNLKTWSNVYVAAYGTKSFSASGYTNSGDLSNPGTYKAVARGRVGVDWFDWWVTGAGVNPGLFQVVTQPPTVPVLTSPVNGSNLNDSTPDLSWTADNANYFHVQVDNNSNFSSPERENANVGAFNWTPSSMSDGTYYWRVRSHGTDGSWSGWSNVWSFTIQTAQPPTVPALSTPTNGVTLNDVTPDLSWSADNANYFHVQVDNNSNFSSPERENTNVGAFNWTPSSMSDGTYYWRVRSHGTDGSWSGWSSVWSFTIQTAQPPTVPALSTPTNGATLNDATPDLSWSADNANYFHVQVDNNSNFSSPERENTNIGAFNWTPSSMSDGTYYWRVRSHGTDGSWSGWSSVWSFTIQTTPPPSVPVLQTPGNWSHLSSGNVSFDWTDASNAVKYRIKVSSNQDMSSPFINEYRTVSNYSTSGLSPGTYYWQVAAYNSNNDEVWTGVWAFVVDEPVTPPPSVPTLQSPGNWEHLSSGNVPFDWTDAANAVKYRIKVSENSNMSSPFINEYRTVSNHSASGLSPGTYYWQVAAYNSNNDEVWTGVWAFVVDEPVTPPPSIPTLQSPDNWEHLSSGNVPFDWTDAANAVKYRIKVSRNQDMTSPFINEYRTVSNYTAYGLSPDTYYWQVAAYNSNDVEVWTGIWAFVIDQAVPPPSINGSVSGGVRDATNDNPIGGATVRLKQNGTIKYEITSASNGTYNISNVTPGTYTLEGSKSGYQTYSYSVTVGSGENLTGKNLVLQKTTQTVNPTVSLSKTTIKRGETFHERGSGFTPNGKAIMYFKQPNGSIVQVEIDADSNGSYDNEYTMPDNASLGDYEYWAKDVGTGIESSRIKYTVIAKGIQTNIDPKVWVNKAEVSRGEIIFENGSGFTHGGLAVMHFKLPDQNEVQQNIQTDDSGEYRHEYTFSSTALLGTYRYWAVDQETGKESNSVYFTVIGDGNTPPSIKNGKVSPSNIYTNSTLVIFSVTYQDRDNDPPTVRRLQVIEPNTSSWKDIGDFSEINDNYSAGTVFNYTCKSFSKEGIYKARAVFNDGHMANDILYDFTNFEVRHYSEDLNTIPKVLTTLPQENAEIVNCNPVIKIRYNVPMNYNSFMNKISIEGSASGSHLYTWSLSSENKELNISLNSDFVVNENVLVRISKGVSSIYGVETTSDFSLHFTTVSSIQNGYRDIVNVRIYADNFQNAVSNKVIGTSNLKINDRIRIVDYSGNAEITIDYANNIVYGHGKVQAVTESGIKNLWSGEFSLNPTSCILTPKNTIEPLLKSIDGFPFNNTIPEYSIHVVDFNVRIKTAFAFEVTNTTQTLSVQINIGENWVPTVAFDVINFDVKIAGMELRLENLAFEAGKIYCDRIHWKLPHTFKGTVRGYVEAKDVYIHKGGIELSSLNIHTNFTFQKFTINGDLNYKTESDGGYILKGSGGLKITGLNESVAVDCNFELWDEGLNTIGFGAYVSSGLSVPIGPSGFFLSGIHGEIDGLKEENSRVEVTVDFYGGKKVGSHYIINGSDGKNGGLGARLAIYWGDDEDGFSLDANVKIIEYITAEGWISYSISNQIFTGGMQISLDVSKMAGIEGSVEIAIWKPWGDLLSYSPDSKLHCYAYGNVEGYIKKGAIWNFWPTKDRTLAEANIKLGPYRNNYDIIYGVYLHGKIDIPYWIDQERSYFINQYGEVWDKTDADILGSVIFSPINKYQLSKQRTSYNKFDIGISTISGFQKHIRSVKKNNKFVDTFMIAFQGDSTLPVYYDNNAEYGAFTIRYQNGSPELYLEDPNGFVYQPDSLQNDTTRYYLEYPGATFYHIKNPINGIWKVIVQNVDEDTQYDLTVYGGKPKAKINSIDNTSGTIFDVLIDNPDTNAVLNIYYDTDDDGYDGRLIGAKNVASEISFTWNTESVPNGSYFVYAMLQAEKYADFAYCDEPIQVVDNKPPARPEFLEGAFRNDGVMVHLGYSSSNDVMGYKLCIKAPEQSAIDTVNMINSTFKHLFLEDGETEVYAYAYDHSGNISEQTDVLVVYPASPADSIKPEPPAIANVEKYKANAFRIDWSCSSDDVQGYLLKIGSSSQAYTTTIDVGNVNSYEFDNLTLGGYCCIAIVAYDECFNFSDLSMEKVINLYSTNDQDGDQLYDDWEIYNWGSIEKVNKPYDDYDNDGLTNIEEQRKGTSPVNPDTDGDFVPDGTDLHPTLYLDMDGDNMPDDWETYHNIEFPDKDPDNDGLCNEEEYQYRCNPNMWDTDYDGISDGEEVENGSDPLSPDSDQTNDVPTDFELGQNYPNPFNNETRIQYSLPVNSEVSIVICNIHGQEICELRNDDAVAGTHTFIWDGLDFSGKGVPSGVYIYRLKTGNKILSKKMILIR